MALTPYTPTTWVNDSEPDLEADNLNKIEQGIASAIDGVNGILNALTNQLSTDQTKFAGIAVVNTLNTALNNLSNTVSTLNSNLGNLITDLTVNKTSFNVSNATSQANNLTSYGKIRIVDLSFRPSVLLQSTQSYTLYTLSLGNRPSYIIDTFTLNSLGHKHRMQINTNGEIKIYPFDDIAIGELLLINMSFAV